MPPLAEDLLVGHGCQGRESRSWGWGAGSQLTHMHMGDTAGTQWVVETGRHDGEREICWGYEGTRERE